MKATPRREAARHLQQAYHVWERRAGQVVYIESFNGKYRDECLSQHWFISLGETRSVSEALRVGYNERRRHRSLQHRTPAEFAAKCGSKNRWGSHR